jgi:mannosylglycerate hydrolase
VPGLGRVVDDGDAGDTYNWSPPAHDGIIDRPVDVDVLVTEAGPVRGRIEVVRRYRWPTHVSDGRRCGSAEVTVRLVAELPPARTWSA